MSLRIDDETDKLRRTTDLPVWNAFTVCVFFQMVVDQDNYSTLISLEQDDFNWHVFETDVDGTSLHVYSGFASDLNTNVSLVVGTWYFASMSHNGSQLTTRIRSLNSPNFIIASVASPLPPLTFIRMYMGGNGLATEPANGRFAGLRVWDAALTEQELLQESQSIRPVRLINLNSYFPLINESEKLVDFSGFNRDLTTVLGGNWQGEENPPISWRAGRNRLSQVASTIYTLDIGASLDCTAFLSRSVNHSISGAITMDDSIYRHTIKDFSGVVSSTGSIFKNVDVTLSALLISGGLINKRVYHLMNASIDLFGSITKVVVRVIGGTLSITGSVQRSIFKLISATLTFAGAILSFLKEVLRGAFRFDGDIISVNPPDLTIEVRTPHDSTVNINDSTNSTIIQLRSS